MGEPEKVAVQGAPEEERLVNSRRGGGTREDAGNNGLQQRMGRWCGRKLRIKNELMREVLAEFLGTFILMVFGDGSVAQKVLSNGGVGTSVSIQFSWGIAVMMGIYVAGGVSGGHINPAVTLAQAIIGRCPWKKVPFYMIAQYCGSFCAAFFVFIIYYDALGHFDNGDRMTEGPLATAGIWATYPQSYVSIAESFGDQVFGTALLLICVLAITDDKNMKPHKGLVPIAIGLVVVVIGMTYGLNCGYAINPARDLAPRIFTTIAGWGGQPFSHRSYGYFWVPVVGPHIGAVLGCLIYLLFVGLHWPEEEETYSPETKKETMEMQES